MNHWLLGIICILLSCGPTTITKSDGGPNLLDGILDEGMLRVGTTGDYLPFTWLDSGQYEGIDIDLVSDLARSLNVEIKLSRQPGQRLLKTCKQTSLILPSVASQNIFLDNKWVYLPWDMPNQGRRQLLDARTGVFTLLCRHWIILMCGSWLILGGRMKNLCGKTCIKPR